MVALLFIATACATQTQTVTDVTETREEVEEKRSSLSDILSSVEQDTVSKNQRAEPIFVPVSFKKGTSGEYTVFGVNFNSFIVLTLWS